MRNLQRFRLLFPVFTSFKALHVNLNDKSLRHIHFSEEWNIFWSRLVAFFKWRQRIPWRRTESEFWKCVLRLGEVISIFSVVSTWILIFTYSTGCLPELLFSILFGETWDFFLFSSSVIFSEERTACILIADSGSENVLRRNVHCLYYQASSHAINTESSHALLTLFITNNEFWRG